MERAARHPLLIKLDRNRGRLQLSSKIKFHVRFENVLAQLPPEGVSGDPTQEMASAPSLPKATAEFIGPPADNASRIELNESSLPVCLHQVDQGLPTPRSDSSPQSSGCCNPGGEPRPASQRKAQPATRLHIARSSR